ncbi:MAG: tetratricopeptide repeat protein, partial [Actinomycetota bacterium]
MSPPRQSNRTDSDHLAEATRLHEFALRERAAGRPGNAAPVCLEAVAILERECGHSSPEVANVLNTLGAVREDLSDYGAAEGDYRRAGAILAGIEGDDGVLVRLRVRTMSNLARINRVHGHLEEAERLFLEAIELAETTFDPHGPELPSLLNDLAVVYKYAARFDEAEALYRRALASIEATLGSAHPEAAA